MDKTYWMTHVTIKKKGSVNKHIKSYINNITLEKNIFYSFTVQMNNWNVLESTRPREEIIVVCYDGKHAEQTSIRKHNICE